MIVFVAGTRPEFIKLGPVAAALKASHTPFVSVATGQHWDLLKGTPAETDLADAISLGLESHTDPLRWVACAESPIRRELKKLGPRVVVVQGDTASALAGARAAAALKIPLAHIEAGVRSGNLEEPWPEEGFRREITQLATWHYAPTPHAVENLLAEGVPKDQIVLTGNPGVSALARYAEVPQRAPAYRLVGERHILLTMHRREWLQTVDLSAFLNTLRSICRHSRFTVIWPVHPAVTAQWPANFCDPSDLEWLRTTVVSRNFRIALPFPYRHMIDLLARAHGLATDSGGLVEEACTLGIPTAILRNANDRPEAVEAGMARQFAPTDLEGAFAWLTQDPGPRTPSSVYGQPDAANRIASHLRSIVCPDMPKSLMASGSSPAERAI